MTRTGIKPLETHKVVYLQRHSDFKGHPTLTITVAAICSFHTNSCFQAFFRTIGSSGSIQSTVILTILTKAPLIAKNLNPIESLAPL